MSALLTETYLMNNAAELYVADHDDKSANTDNVGDFLAMLSQKIRARDEQKFDAAARLRRKQEIEADIIETIMRRSRANAPEFARRFGQTLAWMKTDTKSDFLGQLDLLSVTRPDAVDELVNAIFNLQVTFSQSIAKLNNSVDNQVFGIYSQINKFRLNFTAENSANGGALRSTVKLQLQMQALTQLSARKQSNNFNIEEAIGSDRSLIVVQGQALELSVFLQYFDPIVIDLNGDGINLKNFAEGVIFDLSGDGAAAQCGFVQKDDALLFLDDNGDGVCNDGRELFGDADGYANGFEKLRAYDLNGDNVIDENDEIYDHLRVWNDFNGDGACAADEVRSLREVGVKFIDLNYYRVRENNHGNLITERSACGMNNGEFREVADAKFLSA